MKNAQIDVNYKLLKKYIVSTRLLCFFVFVCLFVVAFFFNFGHGYSTSLEKIRRFHWNIPHSTKETKASSTMQNFWLTIKTLIKFNERGKKKALLFNGESSVIPSLCFLGGFAFGRRIRGDMSMLRFLPFLQLIPTTPFSLELLLFIYNRRKLFKSFVCFKRDILNVRP